MLNQKLHEPFHSFVLLFICKLTSLRKLLQSSINFQPLTISQATLFV